MKVRRLKKSWYYDFTISGYPRQRKAGFLTKAEATAAGRKARMDLLTGARQIVLADAYEQYMAATKMADRSRDSITFMWEERICPVLGHLFLEDVGTLVAAL